MATEETLDKVVNYYVDNVQHIDSSNFNEDDVKKALKTSLKKQIIDDIYETKKKEIVVEAKKEIEEEKRKSAYTSFKQIMWEAFILALVVGLLVNEVSYLIEFLKNLGNNNVQLLVTIILIIVFAIIVLVLYIVKFTKDIIEKFVNNRKSKQ